MDYTIIITLYFYLLVGILFIPSYKDNDTQQICSDEHLYEIRDTFAELYEEVWEEFLQKQKDAEEKGSEKIDSEKYKPRKNKSRSGNTRF